MSYVETHKYVNITADENTSGVSVELIKSGFTTLNIAFKCSDTPTIQLYVKDEADMDWILVYNETQDKNSDLLVFPHLVFNFVKVVIPNDKIDIELAVKAA